MGAFALRAFALALSLALSLAGSIVTCGPSSTCPDGNTCCPTPNATSPGIPTPHKTWGCCADEEPGAGACCGDGLTCCAHGYACSLATQSCVAKNASAHPKATSTRLYHLCPSVIPREPFELPLPALGAAGAGAGGLSFPYYASPALPLAGVGAAPQPRIRQAVVVVHGSLRNACVLLLMLLLAVLVVVLVLVLVLLVLPAPAAATRVSADASRPRSDDYFCSMLGALQLRAAQNNGSHALEESVLVLAPRFTEPRDGAQE